MLRTTIVPRPRRLRFPMGRRPARRPSFEDLERRLVMDSRSFAGLIDFNAINGFNDLGGRVSVTGPVTLRRIGETTNLLKFENGVSFLPGDPSGTFQATGGVSAVIAGKPDLPLLASSTGARTFNAMDLFNVQGNMVAVATSNGLTVPVANVIGGALSVRGLRLSPKPAAPAVSLLGSILLAGLPGINVPVPSNAYLVVNTEGTSSLTADINAVLEPGQTFTQGDISVKVKAIEASYDGDHQQWAFSGRGSVTLPTGEIDINGKPVPSEPIDVDFGTPGADTAGIVVTQGRLTRFQAVATSPDRPYTISNLNIIPTRMIIKALGPTSTSPNQTTVISGSSTLALKNTDKPLRLDLGNGADLNKGIIFRDGKIVQATGTVSVDAAITVGKAITLSDLDTTLDYNAASRSFAIGGAGKVKLDQADREFDGTLANPLSDEPGIVITQGGISRVDVSALSAFAYRGLTFAPDSLRVVYARNVADSGGTIVFHGVAGIQFQAGAETHRLDVSLGSVDSPGLIVNVPDTGPSTMLRLNAPITTEFTIRKLRVQANQLALMSIGAGIESYTIDGPVRVSAGSSGVFTEVPATLGDGGTNHGIVLERNALKSMEVVVQGGLNLHGLRLHANGLRIQYQAGSGRLVFSGGIAVALTKGIGFTSQIEGAGLTIDPSTGELAIATTGRPLHIRGDLDLGPAFGASIDVSYSSAPSGAYSINATGTLRLPQGLPAVAATFRIDAGILTAVSFHLDGPVALGATRVQIKNMDGSLRGLDDVSTIVVTGDAEVQTASKIGSTALVWAQGAYVLTPDDLTIDGHLKVLGGWGGDGGGTLLIDWTHGVQSITVNKLSLLDDLLTFSGPLFFDADGNMTVDVPAALNMPTTVPYVGGARLVPGNFFMQVRHGGASFATAWVNTIQGTTGIRYDFPGPGQSIITSPPKKDAVPKPAPQGTFRYDANFDLPQNQNNLSRVDVVLEHSFFSPSYIGLLNNLDSFVIVTLQTVNGERIYDTKYYFPYPNSTSTPLLQWVPGNNGRLRAGWDTSGLPISFLAATRRVSVEVQFRLPGMEAPPAPIISSGTTYKSTTYVNTSAHVDSVTGVATITATIELTAPDVQGVELSLFATDRNDWPNGLPRGGRLVRTFAANDPAGTTIRPFLDPTGTFIQKYWLILNFNTTDFYDLVHLDAAGNPTNRIYFHLTLDDGQEATAQSTIFGGIVAPAPAVKVTAPDFVPTSIGAVGTALKGAFFSPTALNVTTTSPTSFTSAPNSSGTYTVTVSVDQGGFLTRAVDPRTDTQHARSWTSSPITLGTGTKSPFDGLKFVADSTFSGQSWFTITTTNTVNGRYHTFTKMVRVIDAHADLTTDVALSDNKPVNGDVVTVSVTTANIATQRPLDSQNTFVDVVLPRYLSVLDWTSSVGVFDAGSGRWNVGTISPGQAEVLTIRTVFSQPTFARSDPVVATALTTTLDLNPNNSQGSAWIIADGKSRFNISGLSFLGTVLVNTEYASSTEAAPVIVDPNVDAGAGGPYVFSAGPGMPPGLTLGPDGLVRGLASRPGNFAFRVTALDRIGNQATRDFNLGVADERTPVGQFYRHDFSVSRGSLLSSFEFVPTTDGPVLPPGLSLSGGALFGTPTTPGFYPLRIKESVWTSGGTVVFTSDFFLRVYPVALALTTTPAFTSLSVGTPIDFTIKSPGRDVLGYTIFSGVLPPGVTLDVSGRLHGTPTSGIYPGSGRPVVIQGADGRGVIGTISLNLAPAAPLNLPVAGDTTLPAGVVGRPFSAAITGYAYSGSILVTADQALPDGLSLFPDGRITGTPTTAGATSINFRIYDKATGTSGPSVGVSSDLIIYSVLDLKAVSLPPAVAGRSYRGNLATVGGSGAGLRYSIVDGALPGGLGLVATDGSIVGTPTEGGGGLDVFTIQVVDSTGATTICSFQIETLSIPLGNVGSAFSQVILDPAIGTNPRLAAGELPPGMWLNGGSLVGTPSTAGSYSFVVTYDSSNGPTFRNVRVAINPPIIVPTLFSLGVPSALQIGRYMNASLAASGGSGTGFVFSISQLTVLPPGISLTSAGLFNGTPTRSGTYTFDVNATDSLGGVGTRRATMTIFDPIAVDGSLVPTQTVGQTAKGRLVARGGPSGDSLRFALTNGSLPDGLTLDPITGLLVGVPISTGTFFPTITAADANGNSGRAVIPITVQDALDFLPRALGTVQETKGLLNWDFSGLGGGGGPYSLSATGLPAFLAITTPMRLTNTSATVPGTYRFDLTVSDHQGNTVTRTYDFVVNSKPVVEDASAVTLANNPATLNLLSRAHDPEGQALMVESVESPVVGSVQLVGDRAVYMPLPGITGPAAFRFTVVDAGGGRTTAVAIMTVRENNGSLLAGDDRAEAVVDTPLTIDVLANDIDQEGDLLSILSTTNPSWGRIRVDDNRIVYMPRPGFTGTETFQYTATDGNRTSTATVTVETQRTAVVGFQKATLTVAENAGAARVEVKRAGDTSVERTIPYTIAPTGTSPAVLGRDFLTGTGLVTFAAGSSTAVLSVPVLDNGDLAPARVLTFTVQLQPRSWVTIAEPSSIEVAILDDEVPAPPPPTPPPVVPVRMTAVRAIRATPRGPLLHIALDFDGAVNGFSNASRPAAVEVRRAGRDRKFGTRDDLIVAFAVVARNRRDGGDPNTRVLRPTGPNARASRGEALQVRALSGLLGGNGAPVRAPGDRPFTIQA